MNHHESRVFVGFLLVLLCSAASVPAQPPSVPRIVERSLDQAAYVQLAKEWKEYIAERGESAVALVNLGTAYEYSGEKKAALIAGRRAVEIDPDNPEALVFLGHMIAMYEDDEEAAIVLLERCIKIVPDHKFGLLTLSATQLKTGELAKADGIFEAVFDQRVFAAPLEDFAYNLLVGLPPGAVLVTNGDNDTFPCLALQVGMDFRKDVAVINRHLLNKPAYAEAVFARYPSIRPKGEISAKEGESLPAKLLRRMVDEKKGPVYFACTIPLDDLGFKPDLTLEGLSFRSTKKGLTAEESARLVLEKYRLDSATDWGFAWDIVPTVSKMMTNYVACMINHANMDGVSRETRRRLLDKASEIAAFHEMDTMLHNIKSLQKQ